MGGIPEPEPIEEEDTSWMATFADMVTLLLVFFVLLLSMSTIEIKKFQSVFGSVRDSFGGLDNDVVVVSGQQPQDSEDSTSKAVMELQRVRQEILQSQENTFNAIKSYLSKKAVEGEVSAILDEGIIVLRIGEGLLFEQGKASLSPQASKQLTPILEIIKANREMVVSIKGYTDNNPVPVGSRFKDNWELSALRAVSVLRWFIDHKINPLKLTATGMSDLNPLFPNDTPENQAKNRRVEFSLERTISEQKY